MSYNKTDLEGSESITEKLLRMRKESVPSDVGGYLAEPNTTPIMNEVFDILMVTWDEDSLRYMLYVLRHTLGYGKKAGDFISESQFLSGVNGQDVGSGIALGEAYETRRSRLRRTAAKLEKQGYIIIVRGMKINPNDRYPTTFVRANIKKIKSDFEVMKKKLFEEQAEAEQV